MTEFHRVLLEDCPNRRLLTLVGALRRHLRRYLHHYLERGGRVSLSSLPHARIVEALRKGDRASRPAAARAQMAARHRRDRERPPMTRPPDPAELARWRADTPGCERLAHLNNAGAALPPRLGSRRDRRAPRPRETDRRLRGGRSARRRRCAQLTTSLARLLGTAARNLAMQQNSTVAFAQAFAAFDLAPGDLILTSQDDYASNQIMYLALARRRAWRWSARPTRRRAASTPRRFASWCSPAARRSSP